MQKPNEPFMSMGQIVSRKSTWADQFISEYWERWEEENRISMENIIWGTSQKPKEDLADVMRKYIHEQFSKLKQQHMTNQKVSLTQINDALKFAGFSPDQTKAIMKDVILPNIIQKGIQFWEDTPEQKVSTLTASQNATQIVYNMTWGEAIRALKYEGKKLARTGWNGKNMFVYYVPANTYPSVTEVAKQEFGMNTCYTDYFAIKNTDGTVSTWVPSVRDNLAEDWYVVE